jgi:hypothetical protein
MVFAAIVLAQMANAFEGRSTVTSLRVLGQATIACWWGGRRRVPGAARVRLPGTM